MPSGDNVGSVGLHWTNRKIGKFVTLYQRELFKKTPGLGTFCTQSVNEGLTSGIDKVSDQFYVPTVFTPEKANFKIIMSLSSICVILNQNVALKVCWYQDVHSMVMQENTSNKIVEIEMAFS
jgi:hypothetical protein